MYIEESIKLLICIRRIRWSIYRDFFQYVLQTKISTAYLFHIDLDFDCELFYLPFRYLHLLWQHRVDKKRAILPVVRNSYSTTYVQGRQVLNLKLIVLLGISIFDYAIRMHVKVVKKVG